VNTKNLIAATATFVVLIAALFAIFSWAATYKSATSSLMDSDPSLPEMTGYYALSKDDLKAKISDVVPRDAHLNILNADDAPTIVRNWSDDTLKLSVIWHKQIVSVVKIDVVGQLFRPTEVRMSGEIFANSTLLNGILVEPDRKILTLRFLQSVFAAGLDEKLLGKEFDNQKHDRFYTVNDRLLLSAIGKRILARIESGKNKFEEPYRPNFDGQMQSWHSSGLPPPVDARTFDDGTGDGENVIDGAPSPQNSSEP
jgi:hypothetical protein